MLLDTRVWVYGQSDMVDHMKTTVEVSDALMTEARRLAESHGERANLRLERIETTNHVVDVGRNAFELDPLS